MLLLGIFFSVRTFLGIRNDCFVEQLPREQIYTHTEYPNSDHIHCPYRKEEGPKFATITKSLKIGTI